MILAIEEPEAHLHSGAIHQLKTLLEEVAADRQVIISTHEPALVRRDLVAANVLVENNKARPAKSLEELRRALGVQLGENLASPDLVVLVEGVNDAALLEAIVAAASQHIKAGMNAGRIAFRSLNGARNLSHQLRFCRSLVCDALAFLDDDLEGNGAYEKANTDGLLDGSGVYLARRPGLVEAELEDLIDPELYMESLCEELGIPSLRPRAKKGHKLKWSARLEAVLRESGKPKGEISSLISKGKFHVTARAVTRPGDCVIPALRGPIDALVEALKRKLGVKSGV